MKITIPGVLEMQLSPADVDVASIETQISAIYVDAPDKSSGKRVQHIHIKYDGLGFIPPP